MGWKNVRDYYDIKYVVQVRNNGDITIESIFGNVLLSINSKGELVKIYDAFINRKDKPVKSEQIYRLYIAYLKMIENPDKLRELVTSPDIFDENKLITVYKYNGKEIVKKKCEALALEWPNVTTDGEKMFNGSFFTNKKNAILYGINNSKKYIKAYHLQIKEKTREIENLNNEIKEKKEILKRLKIELQ